MAFCNSSLNRSGSTDSANSRMMSHSWISYFVGSLRIPPECVNQVSVQVDVSTKLVSGLGYRRSSKQQHLGCHAWRIFHDLDGQIESRSPAQNPRSSVFIGGQYGRPAITNASQSRYYWPVEVLAITNSSERQDLLAHRIEVDPPLLHIRNIAQMRSLRRAMPDQHVAIGPFAGAHALQEVAHMVLVEITERFHGDRLRAPAYRDELEISAIDPKAQPLTAARPPRLSAKACRTASVEVCFWRCWIGLNVRRSNGCPGR